MNFSIWLSSRLRLNGTGGANHTGMGIAVAGVALALMIMEFTLAIVLGFKNQIADRIMGFDGQISVLPAYDQVSDESSTSIALDPGLRQAIAETFPQARPSVRLSQPGIIKTDNDFAGIYFVGYDTAHDYQFERQAIVEGRLPDMDNADDANKIAISRSVANALQLEVGDRPYACFFVNDAIKSRRFEVAGIYETGFSDYDKTIAFAPLRTLQRVAGIDSISGSQVVLDATSVADIECDAALLQSSLLADYNRGTLSQLYPVDNVKHTGAVFFNWLDLIDTNVTVIFILMTCVAGFTLISSMFILILDRIPTIGLLRALGASKRQISRIFIALAMKVVALGMVIGNALGIGLLLAQERWRVLKLDPDMYYLPAVPVEIDWRAFVVLNIAAAAAAWMILILPSRVAAGISPSQTMRFE